MSDVISIIVPIYNSEKYLKECMDSILSQTYPDMEVLLVDDGSPDNCPQICDEYAAQDGRVQVVHKENGGLSDARNAGIKSASGKYLLFLDSDDKLASEVVIEELIMEIKKNNRDVYYCPSISRFSENFCTDFFLVEGKDIISPLELFDLAKKMKYIFFAQSFVVKRSVIIGNDLFFTKHILHEDMEWIPRLLTTRGLGISVFPCEFYSYRVNPNAITSSFKQEHFDSCIYILDALIFMEKSVNEIDTKSFLRNWFNMVLYKLIVDMEDSYFNNTAVFLGNIKLVTVFFQKARKLLNLRNSAINFFSFFSWGLFYRFRKLAQIMVFAEHQDWQKPQHCGRNLVKNEIKFL